MSSQRVLVYGGKGALGSALVDGFKSKGYWVLSVGENEKADASISVPKDAGSVADQERHVLAEVGRELGDGAKLAAILCVAGGWAGGNAANKAMAANADLMMRQSVWSSLIAARLAALHLAPDGLLQFTGAASALEGTPGMLGYGMAKAAVHQLTASLAADKSGLPSGATVLALLPNTLDTPMNRKWMPKADRSSWTPLAWIADLLHSLIVDAASRPPSGTLLKLETAQETMRSLLLAFLFLPLAAALTCYGENWSKCVGDYCFSSTPRYDPGRHIEIGCLSGRDFFTRRAGQCWTDGWYIYCVCDTDLCNKREFPEIPDGTLQCSEDGGKDCKSCVSIASLVAKGYNYSGCDLEPYKRVNRIMLPQSCVHFQESKAENYVECLCDSGDFCSRSMVKQQRLSSTAVTCAMEADDTCQGALCFITRGDSRNVQTRGCLTNNETLAPALYKPGHVTFVDQEYVICGASHCNDDWAGALRSLNSTDAAVVPPDTTTPTVSREAAFQAEWTALMANFTAAYNDLLARFSDLVHQ